MTEPLRTLAITAVRGSAQALLRAGVELLGVAPVDAVALGDTAWLTVPAGPSVESVVSRSQGCLAVSNAARPAAARPMTPAFSTRAVLHTADEGFEVVAPSRADLLAAAAEAPDLITDGNINEIDYVAETLADQFPESRHLVSTARANVLARAGKNAEALELYRTALTIKPDFVPALFFQAQLLVGMDRPADAEAVLRTATKAKPGHVGSQELLARLLAKRGSLEDARDILRTSIASNPAASTHVLQAEVARLLKRPDDALAEYKAALALRSDHAPALAGLAALLLDQNNTAAALPILAEYLEVAAAQGEPPARIAEIRRVATQLAQVPAETPPGNAAPTGKR